MCIRAQRVGRVLKIPVDVATRYAMRVDSGVGVAQTARYLGTSFVECRSNERIG